MLMNVEHFLLGFLSLCFALRPVTITPVTSIALYLTRVIVLCNLIFNLRHHD